RQFMPVYQIYLQ
nr:Chain B, A motif peptide [Homo sapiens]8FE6_D Chain D, A motif peptide [Homo sapiens]8FE6_F Chain F, A motif peptide [Homo sapiens]8FE6_H Chain H, A motif peptide [Homo sapiens]